MNYSFFIPCVPPKATSQQKGACRIGNGIRFFKKKHVQAAENDLLSLLRPHAPAAPMDGAICLRIKFVFPWRASESQRIRREFCEYPNTTRPDCSNIVKMVEDAMGRLNFFKDDGQNARLLVEKAWGDTPGIHVSLSPHEGIKRSAPAS